MKYNYMNYNRSKRDDTDLGHAGAFGIEAESPEEALAHVIKQALITRKLMGFPMDILVKMEFRLEL